MSFRPKPLTSKIICRSLVHCTGTVVSVQNPSWGRCMVLDIFNLVVYLKNKIKFWFLVDVELVLFALEPCMV